MPRVVADQGHEGKLLGLCLVAADDELVLIDDAAAGLEVGQIVPLGGVVGQAVVDGRVLLRVGLVDDGVGRRGGRGGGRCRVGEEAAEPVLVADHTLQLPAYF